MEHRVSNSQLEELLQHLMSHPGLVKGVGLGARSKEKIDREWNDLAARLNAHGGGATKTGLRWKRYWADLKFKTKNKAALRTREASGTGGGPATLADLTEIDKKIMGIIGKGAVYGDIQHRVPAFNRPETQSSMNTNITNVEEIESCVTHVDYHNEVEVKTSESFLESSPPPSLPASLLSISPSIRGNTSRVNKATSAAPVSPRLTSSRQINESPVSRQLPKRRVSRRINEPWVVELERRRVDAERKLADAALITAEAARTQAECARIQAEATLIQAEASRIQAEASQMNAETLHDHTKLLREFYNILLNK